MAHLLPKIKPKQHITIVTKTMPKKAPSFASLKDDIEDYEKFDINQQRADEVSSDDEAEPQEHGPTIDDQKDEQSEEQKIYGNFINEENQHRRQKPLRRISDSDAFSSSSFDNEFFSSDNGFQQISSDGNESNSLFNDDGSDLLKSSTSNKDQTEKTELTDPFSNPFESSTKTYDKDQNSETKAFIFREEDDGEYQGKNPKNIVKISITTKPKKPEKPKDSLVFSSPFKSRFGDEKEENSRKYNRFKTSKFFDLSEDEDEGLKPHKKKKEKDYFIGADEDYKRFGNYYIDSKVQYPTFQSTVVHHIPQKRKHPQLDKDGNIVPPCRNLIVKEKMKAKEKEMKEKRRQEREKQEKENNMITDKENQITN